MSSLLISLCTITLATASEPSPVALGEANAEPMVHLSDLKSLGLFDITVSETPLTTQLGKQSCAWWSLVFGTAAVTGEPAQVQWQDHVVGFTSEKNVRIQTPLGIVDASWRSLRPHLHPTYLLQLRSADDLPTGLPDGFEQFVTRELEQRDELVVAETCLAGTHPYRARVGVESYMLPPDRPGAAPETGTNYTLIVANPPWMDGTDPGAPLVPPFDTWSY